MPEIREDLLSLREMLRQAPRDEREIATDYIARWLADAAYALNDGDELLRTVHPDEQLTYASLRERLRWSATYQHGIARVRDLYILNVTFEHRRVCAHDLGDGARIFVTLGPIGEVSAVPVRGIVHVTIRADSLWRWLERKPPHGPEAENILSTRVRLVSVVDRYASMRRERPRGAPAVPDDQFIVEATQGPAGAA